MVGETSLAAPSLAAPSAPDVPPPAPPVLWAGGASTCTGTALTPLPMLGGCAATGCSGGVAKVGATGGAASEGRRIRRSRAISSSSRCWLLRLVSCSAAVSVSNAWSSVAGANRAAWARMGALSSISPGAAGRAPTPTNSMFRNLSARLFKNCRTSLPLSKIDPAKPNAPAASESAIRSTTWERMSSSIVPRTTVTSLAVTCSRWYASTCSSSESESRYDPSAARAISVMAAASARTPSAFKTSVSRAEICATEPRLNSYTWQREAMVIGNFSSSVVASTKTTPSGGSSSVFRNASMASRESWWASSMM